MTRLKYEEIRTKGLILIIGFGLLGIFMTSSSIKDINDVESITGTIESCGVQEQTYKINNKRYTYYFKLSNYGQFFGIFLGSGEKAIQEGKGYEKRIKKGDIAKVYFDNNLITKSENITRLLLRLEINDKVLFSHKPFINWFGVGLITISLIFTGLLIWAKVKRDQFKKYGTQTSARNF
jgi:hypothetical protein